MVRDLLQYSIKNNLAHIPSALSMLSYLNFIFKNKIVTPDMNIIIGKPFGSQAYYLLWNKYWNLPLKKYSYIINHDEIDFIDFSEDMIGNSLGVAAGIYISNNKYTWVNISDATLQVGTTLEAIQLIGNLQQNILLTVDFNNEQLVSNFSKNSRMDIIDYESYFNSNGWNSLIVFNKEYESIYDFIKKEGPKVILFSTIKGDGVLEMKNDPIKWHYRKLKDIEEVTIEEENC